MKILFTILFVLLSLMPAKQEVAFDYDKSVDFGEFRTFAIGLPTESNMKTAAENNSAIVSFENENLLEGNIIYQMQEKGYTQSQNPDLMVTFNIRLDEETKYEVNTVDVGPGIWGGYYYGGYYGYDGWPGMSVTSVTSEEYQAGSVVIDVVSTKTNKLVWYGASPGVLTGTSSQVSQQVPSKIENIFDNYFWKAGQSEPVKRIPGSKK
ncbi:MAG: hypothetical protein C0591_05930 [Marinilabiliales bacterium]|nr:MAG: hypothetical protein C0591_05930 [Marinilabiliales bacterium]